MKKQYNVILKNGDMMIVEAESLAALIEKLKEDGLKGKDIAVMWLRCEVYDYHWR